MRLAIVQLLMVSCSASLLRAQSIPVSIAKANAEGAEFAHAASGTPQAVFTRPTGGASDRRCERAPSDTVLGSWRAGDFIVRGAVDLQLGKVSKALWIPLHGAELRSTPLLLRAVRVGHPGDSLRLSSVRPVRGYEAGGPLYGCSSVARFPAAGQWLAVATANEDWGCFVFDVREATHTHQ